MPVMSILIFGEIISYTWRIISIDENHRKEVFVSFNSVEYDKRKLISHPIIYDPARLYTYYILIISLERIVSHLARYKIWQRPYGKT